MVQRGSVCFHPSRSEIARGPRAGVPTLHCSATAAALTRIHQKIERLTHKTPPVFSGTAAVTICGKSESGETARAAELSQPHQKYALKLSILGGVAPPPAAVTEPARAAAGAGSLSGGCVGLPGQCLDDGGHDFRQSLMRRPGGTQVYRDPQGLQSLGPL